jgi:hypothetical protein
MDEEEQKDLPQFNYRDPGEPETYSGKSYVTRGQSDFPAHGSRPKTRTESGISEMAGMSEPKTLKDVDDENTWSPVR